MSCREVDSKTGFILLNARLRGVRRDPLREEKLLLVATRSLPGRTVCNLPKPTDVNRRFPTVSTQPFTFDSVEEREKG